MRRADLHRWISWAVLLVVLAPAPGSWAKAEEEAGYDLSRLEGFSWVLLQLKQDYVDPSRVRPAAMVSRALEYIERRLAEVEIKLSDGIATVQVGANQETFHVGEPATVWEMNYNLQPIIAFIGKHLETSSDPRDVEFATIDGMLATLDPHSNLLSPELFREMQLKTVGEFGGLGIRITIRKGVLTIISPLPDTPASRLGLRAMDQIVRIGDQSTVNMPLDEAVSMLRGKPKSKVIIWVMRDGWSEPHKYVITRETIRVRSIESKLLDKRIGYIQIQDFGRHTAGDLLRHLSEMKREAKGLRGLILDLRNNAGGLMKSAVQVADMFLDRGIIVATVAYSEDSTEENKQQKSREEKRAREDGADHELPLVVLTNSGSASASEILAGALKNLDRAVLMGEQTFGKGTVQILNDRVPESIGGACLKLTVAEYLIPGDISIQEVGVTPDIQLVPMVLEKDGVQAFAQRFRFREEDIPAHLKKHGAKKLQPAETIRYVYEEEKKDPEGEEEPPLSEPGFKEDFEIKLAQEFLLRVESAKGSSMLDEAIGFLQEVQKEEQLKLEKRLGGLGVDWSAGSAGEVQGKADFKLTGEGVDPEGKAKAESKINMRLEVTNTGSVPFFRLRAESSSKFGLFDRREFLFGRVDPGETKSWEVPVKIPRGSFSRTDDVRFNFHCEGCTPPSPLETTIGIKGFERPAFGFSWRVLDPSGNRDGLIQPGENVELELSVHNLGKGKAFQAKALLKNEAGKDLFLKAGKGRVVLSEILPGKTAKKAFHFNVRKDTKQKELPVELTIWDSDLGTTQTAKIKLPVFHGKSRKPVRTRAGMEVKRSRAEIRSGADTRASLIAFAKKGTVLLVDRKVGSWYRIKGKKESAGWIHADAVKKVPAQRAKAFAASSLLPFQQVTPPAILLDPVPSYVKDDTSITLTGRVEDEDVDLRDVAVWIGDDKVHLKSGSDSDNPRSLPFKVKVRLNPGPNVITVMAREGAKYSVQNIMIVTRPGGLDWKEDRTQLADGTDPALILE